GGGPRPSTARSCFRSRALPVPADSERAGRHRILPPILSSMKRFPGWLGAAARGIVAVAAVGIVVHFVRAPSPDAGDAWAVLERYCVECHNQLDYTAGVSFEGLGPDSIPQHAETFEAAIRKLRGRLMPPPGSPQPGSERLDDLVAFLETSIDSAPQSRRAGYVPIHRLNRIEYAAAVEDLLGVAIDPAEILPADIEVDGFTNIAAALSVSPALLEQYVAAARTIARLAVGSPNPKMSSAYYPPPADDQDEYVDGLPLGTRGGIRIAHRFPADGTYRI